MKSWIDESLGRLLCAWVDAVRPRARLVLISSVLVAALALVYAARNLGVNSDGRSMVAEDLAFRRAYDAFARDFPILDDALLVVVDADSALRAGQAAERLAARLERQPELFSDVHVIGGGEFFERNALLYLDVERLEDLADRLATLQPLLAEFARDGSLQRFAELVRESIERSPEGPSSGLDWAPIFDRLSEAAEAVLADDVEVVSWEKLLLADASLAAPRRVLVAQPVLEFDSLLPAREAIRAVRRAVGELGLDAGSGVTVRLTGNPVLNYEEMVGIARGVVAAGLASFALVAAILWFGLRSRSLVSGILFTLLVGLALTAAFAAFAVGRLNLISITFAVLFIGLGVDFGIHLAMRYAELVRLGRPHADALRETARSVGGSLVLCAGTTAIGFYVFLPTEYVAVSELGLIAGTGMFVSLFCTLTLLPAWLTVVPLGPAKRRRAGAGSVLRGLAGWPFRHAVTIRLAAVAVGLLALCVLSGLRFDPNVVRLRDPGTESVRAFEDLLESRDTSPWSIDVIAADARSAERLARRLDALGVVERALVLPDYVPDAQEEKREILADVALFMGPRPPRSGDPQLPSVELVVGVLEELRAALRTPGVVDGNARQNASVARLDAVLAALIGELESGQDPLRDLVALDASLLESLRDHVDWLWTAIEPGAAELANLPGPVVSRMLTPDGRARVQVFPSEDLGDSAALARFVDTVQREAPASTGSAVALVSYARTIVHSLKQALASAVVVIALLLWLLWRRLADTALVLSPLALAAALTGAAAVMLDTPFNFANVIVLPLLLGIGVDSGIHLVHRWRYEGACDLLQSSTARAVLFSALTTSASFGSLAFSDHRGMASLGLLLSVGIAMMLVANLIVLPALLTRHEPLPPLALGEARPVPTPPGR